MTSRTSSTSSSNVAVRPYAAPEPCRTASARAVRASSARSRSSPSGRPSAKAVRASSLSVISSGSGPCARMRSSGR